MNKTNLNRLKTPFSHNLFIVNHTYQHKFTAVAKAGSTSLKYFTAKSDGISLARVKSTQDIHDLMGYKDDHKHLIAIDSKQFPYYTRVGVFRDPLERVTSWYKDKVMNDYNTYTHRTGLTVQHDFERILAFLRFELGKSDPEWIDEHLRPHARYFKDSDIDVLVELPNLNDYLQAIGGPAPAKKYYNQSKSSQKEKFRFPDEVAESIKGMYSEDYLLLERLAYKTWQPNHEKVNIFFSLAAG